MEDLVSKYIREQREKEKIRVESKKQGGQENQELKNLGLKQDKNGKWIIDPNWRPKKKGR